jgi:DNA invertase Pin-like site-specific DNA recombinase
MGCTLWVFSTSFLRSTRDLLNVLHTLGERQIGFRSLTEPMIDTTSASGKLLLAILASIGGFERHLIRARTDEGRNRAKAVELSSVASPS